MNGFRTTKEALGHRLLAARLHANFSQEKLAEAIGASARSIQRWERGQAVPQGCSRDLLCQVLHLSPEALFGKASEEDALPVTLKPWQIPYPRNSCFTGREDLLARLHLELSGQPLTSYIHACALSGIGGIGKTQLAIEYAYRHIQDYSAIFWLAGETTTSLMISLQRMAEQVQLPARLAAEQTPLLDAVRQWLATHSRWLVIGDNVEDTSLLQAIIPPLGQGTLLLTTRHQTLGTLAEMVELPPMSGEEGARLLLRRGRKQELSPGTEAMSPTARPQERDAVRHLVALLGGLPLALDQAGAYLDETGCTVVDYLQRYQDQRQQVLARRGASDQAHPASVATTLWLSVKQVEQTHPAAGDLLSVCAFLHPEAIPEELFVLGAAHLGPALGPVVANPYHFDQLLAALRHASLVTRHAETRTFSVHRLVQAVLQDTLEPVAAQQWRERVVRVLHAAFPGGELNTWTQCERLLPHVLACSAPLGDAEDTQELVEVFHKAGDYLSQRARYTEAETLFLQALRIQEQTLLPDQPQMITSLFHLAFLSREQGHYERAEALFKRALAIGAQAHEPDGLAVARTLTGLANLYTDQGKYEQAEPLYQRALTLWEQGAGPACPEMARTLNGLAVLHKQRGHYEQAERLYEQALRLRERALGFEHPQVAMTLSNLAATYQAGSNYHQAERLYQRALRIWKKTVGFEHPDVAYAFNNLAELYQEQGQYGRAEAFSRRARRIWEKALGANHVLVAYPLHTLAEIARAQGQQERAEALFKRALLIREQRLAPTHPDIARALMSLGTLYREQGRFVLAAPLYQRALVIREQQLGRTHPDTIAARCAYQEVVERWPATRTVSKPEPPEQIWVSSAHPSSEQQENQFRSFVSDCCRLTPSAVSLSSDLWQAYRNWVAHHRVPILLSRRAFAHRLAAVGCRAERTNTVRRWCGIAVALRDT